MREEVFQVDFLNRNQPEVVTIHREEAVIARIRSRFPAACLGEWQQSEDGGRYMATQTAWANATEMQADEMQDRIVAYIVDETQDDEGD